MEKLTDLVTSLVDKISQLVGQAPCPQASVVPSNTGKQAASSKTHDVPWSDKEVSDSESSESDGDFIAIMDDADDGERESNTQLSQQSVVFKRKIDTGAAVLPHMWKNFRVLVYHPFLTWQERYCEGIVYHLFDTLWSSESWCTRRSAFSPRPGAGSQLHQPANQGR